MSAIKIELRSCIFWIHSWKICLNEVLQKSEVSKNDKFIGRKKYSRIKEQATAEDSYTYDDKIKKDNRK
jgi:hypothetical protein